MPQFNPPPFASASVLLRFLLTLVDAFGRADPWVAVLSDRFTEIGITTVRGAMCKGLVKVEKSRREDGENQNSRTRNFEQDDQGRRS